MCTLRLASSALMLSALVVSCTDQTTSPAVDGPQFDVTGPKGPLMHHVSAGSPDGCGSPGCDANFSLVANMYADGSVTGQWQDAFANRNGIHVTVDCLNVVGNGAVVGGVITASRMAVAEGRRALTVVWDNGTSANDPADQISYSFWSPNPAHWTQTATCHTWDPAEWAGFELDLGQGQVKVW